jgi:hypothetical protein
MIADTSCGEYSMSRMRIRTELFGPSTTVYGTTLRALRTSSEKKKRPRMRLTEYTVLSGLVMICFLASLPTRTRPSSMNDTTEAWVRSPHSLATTVGTPSSMIATHE